MSCGTTFRALVCLTILGPTGLAFGQDHPPTAEIAPPDGPAVTLADPVDPPASTVESTSVEPASSPDVVAIRAASKAFVDAFDAGDAKAVAACWTVDGAYVDDAGVTYDGREAIEQEYAAFFAARPDAKLRLFVDSVRMLSDSAAIEDGRAFVDSPDGASPAFGKYVAVHVKVDGKWLMSTVRDTRVEVASAYDNVADLEWLIGEWSAEQGDVRMTSVCRWVANKSFVERKYAVTRPDGTTTAGVQLIGWNPQIGSMQSWTFSSDGGHAVGVWAPVEGGWLAQIDGVTGDGTPSRAVNRLIKLDDGAYVWKSTERSLAGQPLPDTDEVVLKRRAEDR